MNEELAKQLAAFLGRLNEAAQAGGEFVLAQAPLVIQEKVLYGRVIHTALVIGGIAGALMFVWAARLNYKIATADEKRSRSGYGDIFFERQGGALCVAMSVGAVVSAGIAMDAFGPCIKAWLTPRLYILEWIAGLLT